MITDSKQAKKQRLDEISVELQNLVQSPLFAYRTSQGYFSVPGEGNPDAEVMLIGEAPGEKEAKTGRPFVGRSGKFLDSLLDSIGLKREDVFITNIVKDRPPDNRDPSTAEIALYSSLLIRQIQIIRPRVIATLGRFSMDFILGLFNAPERGQKISSLHGQLIRVNLDDRQMIILPLFHPAVALYNQGQKTTLEADFKVLQQILQQ